MTVELLELEALAVVMEAQHQLLLEVQLLILAQAVAVEGFYTVV